MDNSCGLIGSNETCGSKKLDVPNQGQRDRVCTSLRAIVNVSYFLLYFIWTQISCKVYSFREIDDGINAILLF